MDLIFGYVALYGMSRSVTTIYMILMYIFLVIIYLSFMVE
jgi:hypothetical protein